MKRILSVVAVATLVAFGGITVSSPAQAGNEGAIIGGVVGGLALGAIIAGSQQQRPYRETGHYDQRAYGYRGDYQPAYAQRRQMCVQPREVWSNRHQAYVTRNVRVSC